MPDTALLGHITHIKAKIQLYTVFVCLRLFQTAKL